MERKGSFFVFLFSLNVNHYGLLLEECNAKTKDHTLMQADITIKDSMSVMYAHTHTHTHVKMPHTSTTTSLL